MPLQIAAVDVVDADRTLRRELRLVNLYRILEAALLVLVLFGPVAGLLAAPRHDLFGSSVAIAYLFIALLLFAFGRRGELRDIAFAGIASDLFFGILAMHALPAVGTGIALMLMFNVGAAALLLPPRLGVGAAIVAVLLLVGEYAVEREARRRQRALARRTGDVLDRLPRHRHPDEPARPADAQQLRAGRAPRRRRPRTWPRSTN